MEVSVRIHLSVDFQLPRWIPQVGWPLDYQRQLLEELSQPYEAIFELPDGHQVTLGRESFQAPEAMFQPSLCAWAGLNPWGP